MIRRRGMFSSSTLMVWGSNAPPYQVTISFVFGVFGVGNGLDKVDVAWRTPDNLGWACVRAVQAHHSRYFRPKLPSPAGGERRPIFHQPTSHEGVGPNRSTRKSISARTRDESVRLGK